MSHVRRSSEQLRYTRSVPGISAAATRYQVPVTEWYPRVVYTCNIPGTFLCTVMLYQVYLVSGV